MHREKKVKKLEPFLKDYKKENKYDLACSVVESLNANRDDYVFTIKDLDKVKEICEKIGIGFIYKIFYDQRNQIDYIEINPTEYIDFVYFDRPRKSCKIKLAEDEPLPQKYKGMIFPYNEVPMEYACCNGYCGRQPNIIKTIGFNNWNTERFKHLKERITA